MLAAPRPRELEGGHRAFWLTRTSLERGRKKKERERKRKQSPNSAAGKILRAPAVAKINSKDGLLLSKGIQMGLANPILTGVLLGVPVPSPTSPAACWGLS